jgi:hypothetical protein
MRLNTPSLLAQISPSTNVKLERKLRTGRAKLQQGRALLVTTLRTRTHQTRTARAKTRIFAALEKRVETSTRPKKMQAVFLAAKTLGKMRVSIVLSNANRIKRT